MNLEKEHKSPMEVLAAFIVDKRNLIFFFYICAMIFSIVSMGWVNVENDITAYLPDDTETRQGLTIMEDELTTYGSARIVVAHASRELAEDLADRMAEIDGVTSAAVGTGSIGGGEEETEDSSDYIQGSNVLISVTFDGEAEDEISLTAMEEIKDLLAPYDAYVSSEVGNDAASSLASEMRVILVIAFLVIVLVLLFTSRSYAELPVLMITFGSAALLNMGTNFLFGTISFVSNSVTVVLQLALAIDYAIILLHRFTEERERLGEDRAACIAALAYSIPAISSSSLTTISGLAAMMFMQFGLGFDMGLVLIKAICFSMLSVFTLMPGLLMLFSSAIRKTQHRSFVPHIDKWGKLVVKLRYIGAPVFALLLVAGFVLSQKCPYVYGYSELVTTKQNENQIAEQRVNETFGAQNIMALLVPKGDYASEKALLHRLEQYEEVDYALGLSNIEALDGYTLTDKLTPRQFAEMTDMDYEIIELLYTAYAAKDDELGQAVSGVDTYAVPLMDMFFFLYDQVDEGFVTLDEETEADVNDLYDALTDAQAQMLGENYTRMILNLDLPEEGEETFAFLQTIHREAERYYPADQVYLVGDSTSDYDLSTSFERDNILISVLSVVFVILVLLFTFQSVGLPVLLICVIQGSIWINFSFPTIFDQPIFFMGYLVVTSIQMGANIDYAIVISSRYSEMKELMPPRQAIVKALDLAFPTVLTSGTILTVAAFLIGKLSSEPAIVGIGENLSRGTLISIILVMFILLLLLSFVSGPNPQGLCSVPKEGTQRLTAGHTGALRFQVKHLLLITMIHRRLYREDGVEVIPVPLHTVSINVTGVFHRDELPVHQLCDVLHHRGDSKMYRIRDRAVAGMTLMGAAVFTVKQVSVNSNSTMTDVQEEQFIWKREKVLAGVFEDGNHVLIQQPAMVEFRELLCGHVFAHVQTECNLICTWCNKIFAMHMEIVEINKDSKSLWLEIPLPDVIGN